MTMTRQDTLRLSAAVPLALAVLFAIPGYDAVRGTAVAQSENLVTAARNAALHRMSNGKIAFVDYRYSGYGQPRLDVINPDGSGLRSLAGCTTTRCRFNDYVWSNDGKRMAFLRWRTDPSGRYNVSDSVSVTNANGRGEKRLAECARHFCMDLAWEPDGVHLVVSRQTVLPHPAYANPPPYRASLYVLNLKTGGFRQLTHCPSHSTCADGFASWSPDGKKIVFGRSLSACSMSCSGSSLYIMNADGSGLRRLSNLGDSIVGPAWSPDGRSIAFEALRGIFAVAPYGSHLRMLVANGMTNHGTWSPPNARVGKVCSPYVSLARAPGQVWSPDGTRLLYMKGYYKNPFKDPKKVSRYGCGRTYVGELWVTNANGGGQRRLFAGENGGAFGATWSPDGKRIAFSANGDNQAKAGLYLMDANGSHVHRLLAGSTGALAWQPVL